jgi:hypothetical protein
MQLNVFLSHSVNERDRPILTRLESEWRRAGAEVYLAEREFAPTTVSQKVRGAIAQADVVVVLLTQAGTASSWVSAEVGIALELAKPIVPFVEEGVDPTGPIRERDQIRFNRRNPEEAIARTTRFLESLKQPSAHADTGDEFAAGLMVGILLAAVVVLLIVALAQD